MFLRLVRFSCAPGDRAVAEGIAERLVPAIKEQPGCGNTVVFGDDASGEYGLLVHWDSQEHADAAASVIRPQLEEHLAGHVQGPPDARLFEIIDGTS